MKNTLISFARKLRNVPTEAENYLWQSLRYNNLGVKFRRQTIIGKYIVDFVCFEKKIAIEVDGGHHRQSQKDGVRDAWFKSQGFQVLRFWNNDVLKNRDGVLEEVKEKLKLFSEVE